MLCETGLVHSALDSCETESSDISDGERRALYHFMRAFHIYSHVLINLRIDGKWCGKIACKIHQDSWCILMLHVTELENTGNNFKFKFNRAWHWEACIYF